MQGIFFNMVGVTITVSIVIVILLLLSSFLNGRYTVKWRYFIWMILAVRLLLPIDFGLTSPPVELNLSDREILYSVDQDRLSKLAPAKPEELINNGNTTTDQRIAYQKSLYSYNEDLLAAKIAAGNTARISEIATAIYYIGILGFLLRQLGLYLSFRHSTRRWYREVTNPQIIETFEKSRIEMGVLSTFQIRVCKKIPSPMIVGLGKPTLLLPHEGYQNIDLEVILKHELVHFKRSDLWFKLLLISANALHWFNPFVYLMVKEANRDIEISCDEEVLKGADLLFRKRYSERILDLMQGNNYQEAPISTSFHGGRGMMKSRIYHIFDERVKKKGAISFLVILALVILFSACQFDIDQNEWKIPIKKATVDAYGFDERGNRNSEMVDCSVSLPYDMNGDGKNETNFSLSISEKGKNCKLEYKNDDGKTVRTSVFKEIDPGVDYGIQAANLVDQNSIYLLVSIDYRGMPFGSGYWELYKWEDGNFKPVSIKQVQENLQMKILTSGEVNHNSMRASTIKYLFDDSKYNHDYPVAALYFKDSLQDNGMPSGINYAPMSEYDVEGFENWGQDAIGKTMTAINFVDGSDLENWEGPPQVVLLTEETVYITLPNITAAVKQYYQYNDGKWSSLLKFIE